MRFAVLFKVRGGEAEVYHIYINGVKNLIVSLVNLVEIGLKIQEKIVQFEIVVDEAGGVY